MAKEQLKSIYILLGNMDASFWNDLEKSLKKKYKFEFELSFTQIVQNDGNDMMYESMDDCIAGCSDSEDCYDLAEEAWILEC